MGFACFAYVGLSAINLPSSLREIGEYSFENMSSLKTITIPEGITELRSVLSYCEALESVTLPESLETIDSNSFGSFRDCPALKSINIPKNVTVIGSNFSFSNCTQLEVVFYGGTREGWLSINNQSRADFNSVLAYYSESTPSASSPYRHWHYVDGVPTLW